MPILDSLIDGHAHSQFSWDAAEGSMIDSCREAADMGLGGIAFTEHADLTDWVLPAGASVPLDWEQYREGRTLKLPAVDLEGYLAEVKECRRRFPGLRILTGVEISEPHWHSQEVAELLDRGRFDRVLSSVHAGPVAGGACEVRALFDRRPAADVVRGYLDEVTRMIEAVPVRTLAHIDYAARYWPANLGLFDAGQFEAEYRRALQALAGRDGVLEINTRLPVDHRLVEWWIEVGGGQWRSAAIPIRRRPSEPGCKKPRSSRLHWAFNLQRVHPPPGACAHRSSLLLYPPQLHF